MSLHDKASIRGKQADEIYSATDLAISMPKYRFPNAEKDPRLGCHSHGQQCAD